MTTQFPAISIRLLCSLLALAVLSPVAQGKDKKDKAKAAVELKTPSGSGHLPTEDTVVVKDGTPEQLLETITDAEREQRVIAREIKRAEKADDIDQDLKARFFEQIYIISKAADMVTGNKKATEEDIDVARAAKFRALARGVELDPDAFAKPFDAYAERLAKEAPDSPFAASARVLKFQLRHLSEKGPGEDALNELVDFAKAFPDNANGLMLFRLLGYKYSQAGKTDEAMKVYKQGIDLYADSPQVDYLKMPLRNLELIGKSIEVKGPTIAEDSVDLSDLKGKVVLVDFWATWCGPCVEEVPNVKAAYDRYHDKGFEIIGVSADEDRKALEDFVKEHEMTWAQILFTDKDGKVLPNKVIELNDVHSFPTMLLIGRDGKVAAADIRGEAIEKAVRQQVEKSAP